MASLALCAAAAAQPTAFTYQGQLKDSGAPASGLHDFRFRLFDASTGGTQVGATQCVDNLQVQAGLFTATLDFGNQFATPNQRFIEVQVRRDSGLDCSNVGGFTVLAPRQAITPTPLAMHAKSAFSLDAADGSLANAVFVDSSGKVGIGTTAPTHSVHVAAHQPALALQDLNPASQQAGYVSYRDDANIERAWVGYGTAGSPEFTVINARPLGDLALWTTRDIQFVTNNNERMRIDSAGVVDIGALRITSGGNVGLGTSAPSVKLDVRGDIQFGPTGLIRATGGEERLRIIRGTMGWTGTVNHGTGFSATRLGEGRYTVTFTTPFAAIPTVTATAHGANSGDVNVYAVSTLGGASVNSVSFTIEEVSAGSAVDRDIDFIAIGPR